MSALQSILTLILKYLHLATNLNPFSIGLELIINIVTGLCEGLAVLL